MVSVALRVLLLVLVVLPLTSAVIPDLREKDCVHYFYGQGCISCEEVDTFLFKFNQKYPGVTLERFEVYHQPHNQELLSDYYSIYNIPKQKQELPIIFIGTSYLMGKESILSFLESSVQSNEGNGCPELAEGSMGVSGTGAPADLFTKLSLATISTDSIAQMWTVSVLSALFLLLLILASSYEHKFYAGLFYIAGIFLARVLFSIGFFNALYYYDYSQRILQVLMAMLVIIAAIKLGALFMSWNRLSQAVSWHIKTGFSRHMDTFFSCSVVLLFGFVIGLLTVHDTNSSGILLRNLFVDGYQPLSMLVYNVYYQALLIMVFLLVLLVYFIAYNELDLYSRRVMQERSERSQKLHRFYARLLNMLVYLGIIVLGIGVLL